MSRKLITIAGISAALFLLGTALDATAQGLKRNSVKSQHVKNGSLTAKDLRDEAGADFASGEQTEVLTGTPEVVRSVVITAPRPGVVIVNASGFFDLLSAGSFGRCVITTGTQIDYSHMIAGRTDAATAFIPFGATRGFRVGAGSTTFNLVCDEWTGDVSVRDTSLTAIYVPTRY